MSAFGKDRFPCTLSTMTCPNCGVSADGKFCSNCAAPLAQVPKPPQSKMAPGLQLALACGMLVLVGAVILIAILSSSHGSSSKTGDAALPSVAPPANRASDQLATLPASAQAEMLGKAVNDHCNGIKAFYMGSSPTDHLAFWSVRCANGRSYQVGIKADATGSSSIMDCAVLKAVADIDCFVRLDDQAHRPPRTKRQMKADIDRLPPRVKKEMMENFKGSIKRALGEK